MRYQIIWGKKYEELVIFFIVKFYDVIRDNDCQNSKNHLTDIESDNILLLTTD